MTQQYIVKEMQFEWVVTNGGNFSVAVPSKETAERIAKELNRILNDLLETTSDLIREQERECF